MDDECVVFEASSGGANEDQSYTQDDAFKLIRILTSILVLKAYDLKNARFDTFVKYMTIIIQIIKWKITLSVLLMDKDKKFVFEERRSALRFRFLIRNVITGFKSLSCLQISRYVYDPTVIMIYMMVMFIYGHNG